MTRYSEKFFRILFRQFSYLINLSKTNKINDFVRSTKANIFEINMWSDWDNIERKIAIKLELRSNTTFTLPLTCALDYYGNWVKTLVRNRLEYKTEIYEDIFKPENICSIL